MLLSVDPSYCGELRRDLPLVALPMNLAVYVSIKRLDSLAVLTWVWPSVVPMVVPPGTEGSTAKGAPVDLQVQFGIRFSTFCLMFVL